MKRYYYAADVADFVRESDTSILGKLSLAHRFDLEERQKRAWLFQIRFLKEQLAARPLDHLIFEYSIPRMGMRVDNVLIQEGRVLVLEFKVGARAFHRHDQDQVLDYALDLKNFHAGSHDAEIIPILVATEAHGPMNRPTIYKDLVWSPIVVNAETFRPEIDRMVPGNRPANPVEANEWIQASYYPTPSIVEAAQALYQGHDVDAISRSEAANIGESTDAITRIIDRARSTKSKAICFVTGVPGSGKTLAGLNLASEHFRLEHNEHAVFLSGNAPLVEVLREALARSELTTSGIRKSEARSKAQAFIQNIHHFRDEGVMSDDPPVEQVVVFDEAQRAWDLQQLNRFMASRKGISNFDKSEPESLIGIMDRRQDWAVIVCLVGGGQEINTGEAGLPEWFRTLGEQFSHWEVFVSDRLTDYEYQGGEDIYRLIDPAMLSTDRALHLATSIRSFRSEYLSAFVKSILDLDQDQAIKHRSQLDGRYSVRITRDLTAAKEWIREQAHGSERYGLIASSGAHRLRPHGIHVKSKVDPPVWFLNDDLDVRSSYYLEEVATEFDIQGLELDWTIIGWDADFRYVDGAWEHYNFSGTEWQSVHGLTRQSYLKNAYRVLLTRARQGFVIFVPEGDSRDWTRPPEYYDGVYAYLGRLGIPEI